MEVKIPLLILLAGIYICEAFVLTFSAIRASRKMLGGQIWNIYLFFTLTYFFSLLCVLWFVGKLPAFNLSSLLILILIFIISSLWMIEYNRIAAILNIKLKLFLIKSYASTCFLAIFSFIGIVVLVQSPCPQISIYVKLTSGIFVFLLLTGLLGTLQLFIMWIYKRRILLFKRGLPSGVAMCALPGLIIILQLFIFLKNSSGFPYFPFLIQAGFFIATLFMGLALAIAFTRFFSAEGKKREILGDIYLNLSPLGLGLIFFALLFAVLNSPSPWGKILITRAPISGPVFLSIPIVFLAYLMWWFGDYFFSRTFEGKLRELNRIAMGMFLTGYFSHFIWCFFRQEGTYVPLFFKFGFQWFVLISTCSSILFYFTLGSLGGLRPRLEKRFVRTFVILYLLFCIVIFSIYFVPLKLPPPSIFEKIAVRLIVLAIGVTISVITLLTLKKGIQESRRIKELKIALPWMAIYYFSILAFFGIYFYYLKEYHPARWFFYLVFTTFFANILTNTRLGLKYLKMREELVPSPISFKEVIGPDWAKLLLNLLNTSIEEIKMLIPPEVFEEILSDIEKIKPELKLMKYRNNTFISDGEVTLEKKEGIHIFNFFKESLVNKIKGLKREDILVSLARALKGKVQKEDEFLFEFVSALIFELALNKEIDAIPDISFSVQQKSDLISNLVKKDMFFSCLKEVEGEIVVSSETSMNYKIFRQKLFTFIKILEEIANKKLKLSSLDFLKGYGFSKAILLIRPGQTYVLKEDDPEKTFRLFSDLIKEIPGICFTRKPPIFLRDKYGISKEKIWWLSDFSSQDCINPNNLEGVMEKIKDFIKKNEEGVILLEDLEILIVRHSFIRVLSMISNIQRWIEPTDISLIARVGTYVLSEKEMDALSRGMEVFDGNL